MKQTLSIAIATFNEEENIARCLDSVKDWVDEIVVVDGQSADKTQEIAHRYTSHVIVVENKPFFHENKNIAIDACTSDWIFQIDADEMISPELKDEILQIINGQPKENGFWVPRSNYFLGRFLTKGGQYPDYTLRLFRRGKGRLPVQDVHEQPAVEGEVGQLKNNLLHYADASFIRYLTRWNRYTTMYSQELIEGKAKLARPAFLQYFIVKPIWEFLLIFGRHRGYVDGFPGFVFAYFSAMRFTAIYIKYWERKHRGETQINVKDWK